MRAAARLAEVERKVKGAALAHVLSCPSCLARLDQLARAALSTLEPEIGCAECRDRLPALRERLGTEASEEALTRPRSAPTSRLAEALLHLRRCPDCTVELLSLDQVMQAWETGTLPALEAGPAWNLDFLDAPAPPLWQTVPIEPAGSPGQRLRRLASELVVALEAGAARFSSLPGGLSSSPTLAGAFRDGEGPRTEDLRIEDDETDLAIRLVVGPTAGDRAVLGLTLQMGPDEQPLAGARIVLYGAESELLASDVTAEDGGLQFRDLDAGRYTIEVRQPERRWQLPLRVEGRPA